MPAAKTTPKRPRAPRKGNADGPARPDLSAFPPGSGDLLAVLLATHRDDPGAQRTHKTHPVTQRTKNGSSLVRRMLAYELTNGAPLACELCGRVLSWDAHNGDLDEIRMAMRFESVRPETIADYLIVCGPHAWIPRAAESLGCPLTIARLPGQLVSAQPAPNGGNPLQGEELRTGPLKGFIPVGDGMPDLTDGRVRETEDSGPTAASIVDELSPRARLDVLLGLFDLHPRGLMP